uniref:EGF-like domain-containing protein n=1 Tax=Mesocestoides corti TaxID=53468 RepID=A0A5K3FXU3_MESCO
MDAGPGEPVEISPSSGLAPLSPRQRIRTFASPACDPPCENGGGCVQASSGDFVCDCSETLYWGLTCTREHVGWMSQNEDKSSTRPAQEAFASFSQLVNGRVRLRFIFRHPVIGRKVASQGRIQRSVPEEPPGRDMALVTFVGSSGTPVFGLVLTGGELFYVWKNDSTFRTRLDPCNRQTTQLAPNDGAPHLVHLELLGAFLRVKVDGIAFYPRASTPPTCDAWRYFAGGLDGNGSTAVEPDAADEKEATAAFQVITLGAWSNGDDAFDGAIGGWLVTDAEMIRPKFVEAYDTPNTIYRLNNRFDLSGGRFYWVRLNSLTPVIVLHDSATTTLGDLPVAVWFWIVGCVVLGLLMTLLVVWMCLRVRRRRKPDIKGTWRRGYVSIKRMTKSPAPLSSSTTRRLTTDDAARPLKTNGHLLPSSVYRMKANTTANSASPTEPVDNLWRARMLTLQPLNRPVSVIGPTPINAGSTNSLSEYDDTDDIEEILVTPDGESVITLSTNHGISVKQWNTHDGICHKEIFSRQKTRSTASETRGFLALHKEAGLLFADDQNLAQLHPFSPKLPSAAVQLPSTIWGVFPFGDLFLIVAAPLADDRDSFASLHFWSPVLKLFVVQSRLRIKTSWRTKGYLPSNAKRLPPLLSPSQEKVLLRWSCPAVNTYSFCITVDMSAVSKEVASKPNPVIATDPHISATLTKHPIDLRRTTFLTEDYGVTGDSRGFLHIWDVQSGTVYCTVQSDPVPMDGPILNDFSHLPVDPRAIPITALATNESTAVENGRFTWLCSGDESGCVVVRRCVATENGASKNIAARVHAKFRPYSRVTGAYSADTVTCIRLLNRPRRQTNKPEAFLATGDSSGCVRVWLLPQCTQLAQLSASCESSLRDLVLTQPASSATLSSQWVQVVGLVRRDRSAGSSYEHGRVIIVHLSASEDNGVRNAMHSPRIRIIQNQMTTRPI